MNILKSRECVSSIHRQITLLWQPVDVCLEHLVYVLCLHGRAIVDSKCGCGVLCFEWIINLINSCNFLSSSKTHFVPSISLCIKLWFHTIFLQTGVECTYKCCFFIIYSAHHHWACSYNPLNSANTLEHILWWRIKLSSLKLCNHENVER